MQARERALRAIAEGAPTRQVAAAFSDSVRAAVTQWAEAFMKANPPPRPVCVLQLGSTARGEGLPGLRSSSDVDYMLLAEGAQTDEVRAWAAELHADLQRRGAQHGVELCHKLNGVEYRHSPEALLSRASSPFDAGNLCTARRLAGDEALFAELQAKVETFHAETDGDPRAEADFLRPKKAQLRRRLSRWVDKAHLEAAAMSRSLDAGAPKDPSRIWKETLQVGVVAVQALAVLHRLDASNTFDRLDLAIERGLVDRALGARVHEALEHFTRQKAFEKQDLPLASAAESSPHLKVFVELLAAMRGADDAARRTDGFEHAGPHRALAPRAPTMADQPRMRPHELRIARAAGG